MIEVIRHQHPVGQGCFSTGEICLKLSKSKTTSSVHYIYDCGSTHQEALQDSIGFLKSKTSRVDALFISHFDNDHVSGIDYLLKNIQVDTVYIPYIGNVATLIELIVAEEGGPSSALIEASLDPGTWFSERGVSRIVFVNSGEPPIEGPNIPNPIDELPVTDTHALRLKPESTGSWKSVGTYEIFEMNPGDYVPVTANGEYIDWVLIPYVHPVLNKRLNDFENELIKMLGISSRNEIASQILIDAIKNEPVRKKIKICYEKIVSQGGDKKHNRISMSLYSGPTGRKTKKWHKMCFTESTILWPAHLWLSSTSAGWIGTGDADLGVKKIRTAWCTFYKGMMKEVSTILLPHHGSSHNFHTDLIDSHNLELCAASAGTTNSHGHPSRATVAAVQGAGKRFWHISERPTSCLTEIIRD